MNAEELSKEMDMNIQDVNNMLKIASVGLATIITFIAIYLGVIFLLASSAILALKQLTDSSDNKQRYTILRKIGCDEKMINKSLFRQIGIFFGVPLLLAIIHSVFGIQFAIKMMAGIASEKDLLPSAATTVVIIGVIYGIGIELCVNSGGNFEKTFNNATKLVAYLLKEYNLTIYDLKTHHDFSGKDCPHSILKNNRMDEFIEKVEKYM